jgi:IS5 family transposase
VLEERAREQAKSKGEPEAEKAKPEAKMQYNFTDPESRIMKGADGFVQAYNAQLAVEPDLQLIVGQQVTQEANDKQQMKPMVKVIEEQAGQKPGVVISDSGYCSEANLKYLEKKKIEGFVAVDRESYPDRQKPCPRGPLAKGATRVDRMRRKLQTKKGAAIYSTRKTVVEPVFGQIKEARGFRRFLLRGLKKVQAEWALLCLTHNILKLYRLCYG